MSTFFYFAYGSNMLTERLQARCPSARARGVGVVRDFDLTLSKRSVDGSGKAALVSPSESETLSKVFGVCFEIDCTDRESLDAAEGDGYDRQDQLLVSKLPSADLQSMTSYVGQSHALAKGLLPYDWYVALMIAGARQHALPDDYVTWLECVPSKSDPQLDRPRRLEAQAVLKAAGYPLAV